MDPLPLAVLYLRMSTGKQDTSIQQQLDKILPWIEGKYQIIEEYRDEGKSGSKDIKRRVRFLQMIHDLTEGKYRQVKTIVCLDMSRFGRLDSITGAKYKEALRDACVSLHTINDGIQDWATSINRIVDAVHSEGNHGLALQIGEKGLNGRIQITKAGKPNQVTPYAMAKIVHLPTGDVLIPRKQTGWATPKKVLSKFCPGDPVEVEAVQYMFQTYATESISRNELARRMTAKGWPSPTGIGWHGDTIDWMLRNPIYAGGLRIGFMSKGEFFRVQKETATAKRQVKGNDPIEVWETHTGIIDKPLWDAVQEKHKRDYKSRGRHRRQGPYCLTGIIHCGACGKAMYGSKDNKGRVIYRCHRGEVGDTACGGWLGYEEQILPLILDKFLAKVKDKIEQTVVQVPMETTKLQTDLDKLEKKISNAQDVMLEAPKELRSGLQDKLLALVRQRQEMIDQLAAEKHMSSKERLEKWLADFTKDVRIPVGGEQFVVAQEKGEDPKNWTKIAVAWTRNSISPKVLRERLLQIGCVVSCWWIKNPKKRGWLLDKVRLRSKIGVSHEESGNAASACDTCIDLWLDREDFALGA